MSKSKREIGMEILEGIREIKGGDHGRAEEPSCLQRPRDLEFGGGHNNLRDSDRHPAQNGDGLLPVQAARFHRLLTSLNTGTFPFSASFLFLSWIRLSAI